MSSRSKRDSDAASLQQRLPFSNADIDEATGSDAYLSASSVRLRPRRSHSHSSNHNASFLSSSVGRNPARSYFHQVSHSAHSEIPAYSSQGVRAQTAELASWGLGDSPRRQSIPPARPHIQGAFIQAPLLEPEAAPHPGDQSVSSDSEVERRNSLDSGYYPVIDEVDEGSSESSKVSEPVDLEAGARRVPSHGSGKTGWVHSSASATPRTPSGRAVHKQQPQGRSNKRQFQDGESDQHADTEDSDSEPHERTVLLPKPRFSSSRSNLRSSSFKDGGYGRRATASLSGLRKLWSSGKHAVRTRCKQAVTKSRQLHWTTVGKDALGAFSAVLLGLLLNILDAMSYGMILFPLGEEIFADTGADGIAIFYVSCIVSQLVYSLGGSRFKGGVGSEMIEVVPFFHKMAYMALESIGREPEHKPAVLATVITSYALSSVLTGVIFLLLSVFKLGDLVSFFPRSILLGCIGGVGLFLFLTGIEVSAGLSTGGGEGGVDFSLATLERLLSPNTLILWTLPLLFAVLLMVVRKRFTHPVVLPAFFGIMMAVFYIVYAAVPGLSLSRLQKNGWVFEAPEGNVPFWRFYTYYNFRIVDWRVVGEAVPTMFALSFFGIIHVPINVPALGIAVQEDDVNINRELFGHGLSNTISGLVGSIQNYLVFANSRLFIQNGGNSRAAGLLLAAATTGVWVAGPAMIGFIPVMVVGTLIFMLGIEMMQEAVWDTLGKLQNLEWFMILAITLVMGFWDFVVGIMLGIVLACLTFVVQTSRVSAVRATYSGTVARSTVRRHPVQRRFLHEVGTQIKITKLAGYLFFGTIVAVEKRVRELMEDDAFAAQPIRYLILDFSAVTGLDFSAAEAFVRMNRILRDKGIEMVLSSVPIQGEVGRSLIMVGLLDDEEEDAAPPPRVFEDLNQALEACENEMLIALKERSEKIARDEQERVGSVSLTIPRMNSPSSNDQTLQHASPRRSHLQSALETAIKDASLTQPAKYASFAQPLPLLMQAFADATTKPLDFWHRATPYYERRVFTAGSVLYSRGDAPDGFYVLESGVLRAEYELEQGRYHESITAGTTCGELPFFTGTGRTGTVIAEMEAVAWVLTGKRWADLEKEVPDVARELLVVSLRLTRERVEAVTS
ncbi:hypothetical protein EJ06DRAFT_529372 [Trichodelitschia bisporula]|uniref:Sulfate transporter family protein-like protein n=1 Tax=Trichodelitschia bisporula TaxID=703511 RepID=A0A6G1HZA3_9PEZI|nr:hypothetical protein EJ06DRAFT_529372 [Trichodelitschia bisporula]